MTTLSLNRRVVLALTLAAALPGAALAATGGPDAARYTWADSDEPGVSAALPSFTATDLRAMGFTGDDAVIRLPLPASVFPTGFPFYGVDRTELWLSSNGWLSFVDPRGADGKVPADVPDAADPNATIGFFWDDWTLESVVPEAQAGPLTSGTGYVITIRISPPSDPTVIAQVYVTLHASGVIEILYVGAVEAMRTSRTVIGIENGTGAVGLPYMVSGVEQNGARFREPYAVVFYPPGNLDCATSVTALGCPEPPLTSSNLPPLTNRVAKYNCDPGTWDGNEKVFALTVTRIADVTINLTGTGGRSMKAFLMRPSCSEWSGCLASGTPSLAYRYLTPGTYYVVVDAVDDAANGPFTIEVLCSDATRPIACGDTVLAETLSGTGGLADWSCLPAPLLGPEHVYELDFSAPDRTLNARLLSSSSPDIQVLISRAAGFSFRDPTCEVADPAAASVYSAPPGRYYVTVDRSSLGTGTYDLSVDCSPPLLGCPPSPTPIDLTRPGVTYSGDTTGKPNTVDSYSCTASNVGSPGVVRGYDGPEDFYEFTLATPTTVNFLFAASDPDLRLLLLRTCYEGDCAVEGGCGEELAAGTYLLVVDGQGGSAGSYSITPVVVSTPPYQVWTECPECVGACGQTAATVSSPVWTFDSNNYCGTGCDFSLFTVVECGTEFHLPFYDVETGHIQVWDVLRERFVDLVMTNDIPANAGLPASCLMTATGPYVDWVDRDCLIGGGGSDCRTNDVLIDVSFAGSPLLCGVFRIDFLNWGGFAWEAYANCNAEQMPEHNLYRDLCSALSAFRPRPEIGIVHDLSGQPRVTIDNSECGLGVVRGTIELENLGCGPVTGLEIAIEQASPFPPARRTFLVDVPERGVATLSWDYTLTPGASLVFTIDPGGLVQECHEAAGASVSCVINGPLARAITVVPCVGSDLYKARITFPPTSPARIDPWVYTRTLNCTGSGRRVGETLEMSPAADDVDLSDDIAPIPAAGELIVYQLSCPATERIALTKNRLTGKVHIKYF